jgi:DNA-directed RNA polymerase subunit beta
LISSLCVFAKVNKLGFIETPYRSVQKGKVQYDKEPVYVAAEEEDAKIIAQANAKVDDKGNFLSDVVKARFEGDFPVVEPSKLHLMDVGANQIASIAASSIPFLGA